EDVMRQRHDRANGKLPFEAKPHVRDDCQNACGDGDKAGHAQFARDSRTDHLDAPLREAGLRRVADLLQRRLLRLLAARLLLQPNENIRWWPKLLDLNVAKAEPVELLA